MVRLSRPAAGAVTRLPRSRDTGQQVAVPSIVGENPPALRARANFVPDPYVDYARRLTPQGGIAIAYKDIDLRFRHTLRRVLMWSWATGGETWFLMHHAPIHQPLVLVACLAAAAIINWLIVRRPVEIYRTIEIRPDCMIIDGAELFWLRRMENGWPAFQPDGKDKQKLCGIYGTRFVEYATIHRFDEFDCAPEVLAAHLKHAMGRLWVGPH
jgi:hypothetical protein